MRISSCLLVVVLGLASLMNADTAVARSGQTSADDLPGEARSSPAQDADWQAEGLETVVYYQVYLYRNGPSGGIYSQESHAQRRVKQLRNGSYPNAYYVKRTK